VKTTLEDVLHRHNKSFLLEAYPEIVDELELIIKQEVFSAQKQEHGRRVQEEINKMRLIVDNIQVGIMLVDAETRRILEINPQALKMAGTCREKVVGNICHKFLCPAELNCCPVLDLGQVVDRAERVLLARDGNIVPILKTVVPIQMGGWRVLLESFIDMTEQKQIKNQLQTAREAAEESNRIKSCFLANMSHGWFYGN